MEIFIDIFAGLGLFFVGVKLIGSNLKQLSGRWFRRLIGGATRNTLSAALLGVLSGALTQSSSAITFISISMVTAGLIEVERVGWHARIVMRVRNGTELPDNAIADIRQSSLLGEKYVALEAPPDQEPEGVLEDGDEIILRARCIRDGVASIGFGECRGKIISAN